jgi:hypothetical protein
MSFLERSEWVLRQSLLALALAAVACVQAQREDALGETQFVASSALASTDYANSVPPAPTVGGAAGRSGGGPSIPPGSAAVGGSVSQPLPPNSSTVAGAPGPTQPGPLAAGSGGSIGAAGMATGGARAPIGGAAGAPATAGAPAPSAAAGTLTLDFKTVTQGGTYAPRNVGAVWIETGSGMFVKTVERWAGIRANHLSRWNAASGGWGSFFGGGNTADMMDAVSRATLRSHEMHHVTWDMKDTTGKVVADGMYNVVIECTEDNFVAGPNASVPFMKGPAPQMITAPDKAPFSGFSAAYQP